MKTKPSVFHIIDLDRTLFDTSKLITTMRGMIAIGHPEFALVMDEAIAKCSSNGNSFFIFDFIGDNIGQTALSEYVLQLAGTLGASDLLLPGANDRIAFAASQPEWGMGILTFGSPKDQEIKLKLAGLDKHSYIVTDTPEKGAIISSWRLPNGQYQLPKAFGGRVVDILTFDDDKRTAFDNLPEDVLGQWINKESALLERKASALPSNVHAIPDLRSSVEYLKSKLI